MNNVMMTSPAGAALSGLVVLSMTGAASAGPMSVSSGSVGVDLGRITFVITGVTDGRDNPEEWLRMARENLICGNVRAAPAAVIW